MLESDDFRSVASVSALGALGDLKKIVLNHGMNAHRYSG
jgi:hypothetical protein